MQENFKYLNKVFNITKLKLGRDFHRLGKVGKIDIVNEVNFLW